MRNTLFTIAFLCFISGCTSNIDKLQGKWSLRLHEYYDLSAADGGKVKEGSKPFQNWEFIGNELKVDGVEQLLLVNNDSITTIIEGEFRHFTIERISEGSMLLQSRDFTPGTNSFYYFLK